MKTIQEALYHDENSIEVLLQGARYYSSSCYKKDSRIYKAWNRLSIYQKTQLAKLIKERICAKGAWAWDQQIINTLNIIRKEVHDMSIETVYVYANSKAEVQRRIKEGERISGTCYGFNQETTIDDITKMPEGTVLKFYNKFDFARTPIAKSYGNIKNKKVI